VEDVGSNVIGVKAGDRLACSGSGFACHAEYVSVPQTLCAPVPENVSDEDASLAAQGAIALHALRLAELQLGDRVVILGLGLLGLLAVQIAKAWGCLVFGVDVMADKADLARQLGADHAVAGDSKIVTANGRTLFRGAGADAVVIFASSTSSKALELAAELARVRGRLVVPGLVGMDVPRRTFYEKELDLKVSRAWGPGLYDPDYEEKGRDYPLPFVRWTAGRNMEAFLGLLGQGSVGVAPLITHRFPVERATDAYHLISDNKEPYIGVVLTYPADAPDQGRRIDLIPLRIQESTKTRQEQSEIGIGFIGAGNFAKATLLPAIRRLKHVRLCGIATSTGASARHTGDKFGFEYCSTDYNELLDDPEINTVFIATRHDSHANITTSALRAGKHVFVEKPLCTNKEQLDEIITTYSSLFTSRSSPPLLMIGFNRRFSPFTVAVKKWLSFTDLPMVINIRLNAGFVPPERWEQQPDAGSGRIIGEVCHFVDLIQYLTDADPVQVYAGAMKPGGQYLSEDNLAITLRMSDGSVASVVYTASGDKTFPRERVEVFRGGGVGLIDNFRTASFTCQGRTRYKRNLMAVDRGHNAEIEEFFSTIHEGRQSPVSFSDYVLTTLTTLCIEESIQRCKSVDIELPPFMTDRDLKKKGPA